MLASFCFGVERSENFGKETNVLSHPPVEGLETKYFSHIDDVTPLGSQNLLWLVVT